MALAELRRLTDYNAWANTRMFAQLEVIPAEPLTRPNGSSFPSILATTAHIVGGEWVWLERWLGRSPSAFPEWVAAPSLADLKSRFAGIDAERRAFMDGLTEPEALVSRPYRLVNGTDDSQPFDVMLTHIMNHSTYHRGQVSAFLRQAGEKPSSLDFIVFARQVNR